jgi:hypothetical protein
MKLSLLLLVCAMPCRGTVMLDQFPAFFSITTTPINECCKFVAQTYTAGLTGTLQAITLTVSSTSDFPLEVQIRSVAGGVPTSTILGDTILGSSSTEIPIGIIFPQLIEQVAGTQYAIVLNYPTAPYVLGGVGQGVGSWRGSTGDPYARGQDMSLLGTSEFDRPAWPTSIV